MDDPQQGKKPDKSENRPQIERPIQESSDQEVMRPSVNDEELVTPIDSHRRGSKK